MLIVSEAYKCVLHRVLDRDEDTHTTDPSFRQREQQRQ